MIDELEEKPGERLNLQQYIGVIRRHYLLFLISFFLGWLVFWSASWVLRARYTWGTQIRVPTAYARPYPRRESTRGIVTRASALGNSRDHHPGREKKAPEEPQVDLGADRFCLCHDSGRINHQLPLGVMWLRELAYRTMRTAPDLAQRAV
jgi:hypothetical protein